MSILNPLLPRETGFFDYFDQHAGLIVRAVRLFARATGNGSSVKDVPKNIKAVEHSGDELTHTCMEALHGAFIRPFDREAIQRSMVGLDDILDYIDEAARRMALYNIAQVAQPAQDTAGILVDAAEACQQAVRRLRSHKGAPAILGVCKRIKECENRADAVTEAAAGALFENVADPLTVRKSRKIYESIENAGDAAEDVANVVEGIVLEQA
jgi:predicted phosphate transport protein (TIGR00153 family)